MTNFPFAGAMGGDDACARIMLVDRKDGSLIFTGKNMVRQSFLLKLMQVLSQYPALRLARGRERPAPLGRPEAEGGGGDAA